MAYNHEKGEYKIQFSKVLLALFLIYHFEINQAMNKIQFSIKCCNFFIIHFVRLETVVIDVDDEGSRRRNHLNDKIDEYN